jgi:hypothetical protein
MQLLRPILYLIVAVIGWLTVLLTLIELPITAALLPMRLFLVSRFGQRATLIVPAVVAILLEVVGHRSLGLLATGLFTFALWSATGTYLAAAAPPLNRPPWLRDQTLFEALCLLNRVLFWLTGFLIVRSAFVFSKQALFLYAR